MGYINEEPPTGCKGYVAFLAAFADTVLMISSKYLSATILLIFIAEFKMGNPTITVFYMRCFVSLCPAMKGNAER